MPIKGLPFTDAQLFDVLNVCLPGWVLLALAPRWRHSQTVAAACSLICAALYAATMITIMAFPEGGKRLDFAEMFSYEGIVKLLTYKPVVLPAWTHYITFDLWVGRWMAADSVKRGVPQLLLIPCLFGTLMLGPVGLLLYMLLRLPFNKAAKEKLP